MSLQFVLGPSGYGKSKYVQDFVTGEAALHRDRNYMMIVPDQFTMQTQMVMAGANPDGGIINIDVLSFGRLTHRIFEEVGKPERVMLDDLGKCLILRRVIHEKEGELLILKKGIHTPGYVEEVKSVLSEFMQYGIRPKDLKEKIETLSVNPGLEYKLKDFLLLYEAFEKALAEKYTTKEETLYCLCDRIPLSKSIKKSVLVFDGFTGFTPIQVSVIETLLANALDVIVTLPFGYGECIRREIGLDKDFRDLFYLTKKTVRDLSKAAEDASVLVKESVYMVHPGENAPNRFVHAPALSYLEKNIFRKKEDYTGTNVEIEICKATDETHECMLLCRHLTDLIKTKGYRYRDMAVVCGDLPAYSKILKQQFDKYHIPCFMDTTTELISHPFVAYLRMTLTVFINKFAAKDVCSLLHSGFMNFTNEEIDLMDNYLVAKNIRGSKAWNRDFTVPTKEMKKKYSKLDETEREIKIAEELARLNDIRSRIMDYFLPFDELKIQKKAPAGEWLTAFYHLIEEGKCASRLAKMAEDFEREGKPEKALEYSQVYKTVMKLFDQVYSLVGEEEMTLEEVSEVLDVGYGEIRIGIIPKSVDVLPVCDMIRSRFGQIKALFFIGVNDGNIPAVGAGGGLLSDMERNKLTQSGMELAPNRAMEGFTQQLYLYQILTKPEENLYLSFLSVNEAGESRKASYLIGELKKLFPDLGIKDETVSVREADPADVAATLHEHNILSAEDLFAEFSVYLGDYVRGTLSDEKKEYTKALYAILLAEEGNEERLNAMIEEAFDSYGGDTLESGLVRKLYGEILKCSVSSLEKYAGCPYAYFLKFGLSLKERETPDVAASDLGNITHAALEAFGKYVQDNDEEFARVSEEKCVRILDEATDLLIQKYGDGLFTELEGVQYLTAQVKRLLHRSVKSLQNQLLKGKFKPVSYEQEFKRLLPKQNIMLNGTIDRIDTCDEGDTTYIKIVDYKSGSRDFDEALFAQGVQLQVAVYLSEAMKKYAVDYPDRVIKPGAMLYFRMQDPYLEVSDESVDEREAKRNVSLRPTGVLVGDEEVLSNLESERKEGKSEAVPLSYKKDGSLSGQGSRAAKTMEEMQKIISDADQKVISIASEISTGKIDASPLIFDKYDACKYCAFRTACGFDEGISGYLRRVPEGAAKAEEE